MVLLSEEHTDEQLMAQVQRGHQSAMNALYERYSSRVYGMAMQKLAEPAEAEDATHDVFVSLWQKSSTFRPDRGNVSSWLLAIAHNQIIDRLRRKRRMAEAYRVVALDPTSVAESGTDDPQAATEQGEAAQRVRRALEVLPPEQHEVVTLSYYHGFSGSQIADRLELPLGTVKGRMRLAMGKLREELGPYR